MVTLSIDVSTSSFCCFLWLNCFVQHFCSSVAMDSESFTCLKCGFKNLVLKKQLCGDIYCQKCGAKTDLCGKLACMLDHFSASRCFDEIAREILPYVEKGFCSYCNTALEVDKIQTHYDMCDMYPAVCKLCNRKIIRRMMKIHMQDCVGARRWCKFSPIGCKFQGTQSEIEIHEGDNIHIELMMKLLLDLQHEQTSTASMIVHSFNEQLSLRDDGSTGQCKIDELVEKKSSTSFGTGIESSWNSHQDLKPLQNECCMKIKVKQDNLEELVKKQMMEITFCKQQMIDYELKQSQLMEHNAKLEQNYGILKDVLDQQSKQMRKLDRSSDLKPGIVKDVLDQQSKQLRKLDRSSDLKL
uniref:TRAF-type domain-containing protein n=1 Tax=Strigamia maritima TaxID=126957 RepID=T1JD60_STRMM